MVLFIRTYICVLFWASMSVAVAAPADSTRVVTMGQHSFVLTHPNDLDRVSFQIDSVVQLIRRERQQVVNAYLREGFVPAGPLKIEYPRLIHYNAFEGWKAGLGLWTDSAVCRSLSVGGYGTYSFRRRAWLYGGGMRWEMHAPSASRLQVMMVHDYQATGSLSFLPEPDAPRRLELGHFLTETMDLSRGVEVQLSRRVAPRLSLALGYAFRDVEPLVSYVFATEAGVPAAYELHQGGVQGAWASPGTGRGWHSAVAGNVWLGSGQQDARFHYAKMELGLWQSLKWTVRHTSSVHARAAMLVGNVVPPALYYSQMGSYKPVGVYVPGSFATMRLNEFVADRMVAFFFEHALALWHSPNLDKVPVARLQFNYGLGQMSRQPAVSMADFPRGFAEGGLVIDNLLRLGLLQYGVAAHYRLGHEAFDAPKDNWAFKMVIRFR
ncbi:hypothetical protein [Breznakibacter xylanolyticus]|nr:hypothetical protein [Breznakibacter xylanolyticus]